MASKHCVATALITTSRPIPERQIRAMAGIAGELNPQAKVTPYGTNGFRVEVTEDSGEAEIARVESYRTTMELVCYAGLDVLDAVSEVRESV